MKKIGGTKTLTGQVQSGTYQGSANRIQLFDGKFTTGYRIIEFKIAPITVTFSREAQGKLATEPKSTVSQWHWDDVQELAWAYWGQDKYLDTYMNIRADNMVIEDLYLSVYDETGDNVTWNYEITLEKYEFPAWTGAGVLVENLSQAGPQ
tara:strand:+ start:1720 stop:2169 length:450 start_codon:yes stop_codon:yes gene_type:complete